MDQLESASTSDLLAELKRRYACIGKPEKRLVFLGAPGSGKGTQSQVIRRDYCLCHVSTGDMLREMVSKGTPLGLKAKALIDAGTLVGDDVVVGMIEEKIQTPECRRGFILDGFPRNASQAERLDQVLSNHNQKLDAVLNLDVPDDCLVKRICGRRIHLKSGRSYHIKFAPPIVADKDDLTGEPLVQRKDDNEDTLLARLATFHAQTEPLVSFYEKKGICKTVDGRGTPEDVLKDVYKQVDPNANASPI